MCKEVLRIDDILKKNPELKVWVISKDKQIAQGYWKHINEIIKTDKKPYFISQRRNLEALRSKDAIILLCGQWYKNPAADDSTFRYHLATAKFTVPIAEMPCCKCQRI